MNVFDETVNINFIKYQPMQQGSFYQSMTNGKNAQSTFAAYQCTLLSQGKVPVQLFELQAKLAAFFLEVRLFT